MRDKECTKNDDSLRAGSRVWGLEVGVWSRGWGWGWGGNSGASSHSDLGKHPTQSHHMMMSPEKGWGVGIYCHDVHKQPPSDGIMQHMAHRVRDEGAKLCLLMFKKTPKKNPEAIKEVLGGLCISGPPCSLSLWKVNTQTHHSVRHVARSDTYI